MRTNENYDYKRIRNTKNFYVTSDGYVFKKVGSYDFKQMPIYVNNVTGYCHVTLVDRHGKQFCTTVHKLVANAFLKKPRYPRNLELNHVDGCKQNNHYSNLQYLTHSENLKHAWATGLCKKVAPAIRAKRAKLNGHKTELTETDVRQIRRLRKEGLSNKELGFIYDLHAMQISRICNYRSFANID